MRQIRCMFAVFFLGVLCSSEHAQPPAQQPAADKAIFHLNGAKNSPPVKIVRLMLGQTEIPLDSPVRVEGTWMPKISIVVQNVSPKTIVKAEIMIWFPETRAGTNGPVPSIRMSLGRFPKRAFIKRDGTISPYNGPLPPEVQIAPGTTMTFTPFPDADSMQAKAYELAGHITKASINFDTVFFEDDSKWMAGQYYLAVPPPAVWQPVTPEDFFATAARSHS